jgi:hypothetical protein
MRRQLDGMTVKGTDWALRRQYLHHKHILYYDQRCIFLKKTPYYDCRGRSTFKGPDDRRRVLAPRFTLPVKCSLTWFGRQNPDSPFPQGNFPFRHSLPRIHRDLSENVYTDPRHCCGSEALRCVWARKLQVERDGVFHEKHPDGGRKQLDCRERGSDRLRFGETKLTSSMTGESPKLEILMTRER